MDNRKQPAPVPHVGQDLFQLLKMVFFTSRNVKGVGFRTTMNRAAREAKRTKHHKTWPYCGARQIARYTRQVKEGRLKRENGLVE